MFRSLFCGIAFCLLASVAPSVDAKLTSRFFTTSDGVRLHYLEAGRGPVLAFVPGWTMPAEVWRPQLEYFQGKFRVVALDPRGQGESQVAKDGYEAKRRATDIKEWLEALGAEQVVLVGWSLGVLESLTYIKLFGAERVQALVLVDNSIGEEPPPVSDPTFFKRLRQDRRATVMRFIKGMYRRPQTEAYYQRLHAYALKTPLEASIALLSYPYPRQFWREIVHEVERPLLYAVSPRFQAQAQNLKKGRPDARIEVFEDAGHALFVDQPQRFNRLLQDFIYTTLGNNKN